MHTLIHWILSALAVLLTSKIISGFQVSGFFSAMWAAALIGLANIVIWPILMFLTLPINILTLGLFTFVVNGAVLKLCAAILPGFKIDGWLAAILGAIVLSLVNMAFHYLIPGTPIPGTAV